MRQKNREIQELSYTKIVKFGTIRLCSVVTKRKSVTMCTVPSFQLFLHFVYKQQSHV